LPLPGDIADRLRLVLLAQQQLAAEPSDPMQPSLPAYCETGRPALRRTCGLGPVEIWGSPRQDIVIQAWDGPICANRCPMGEDGTALPGEEVRPRSQW
jgi:hypothetical protein